MKRKLLLLFAIIMLNFAPANAQTIADTAYTIKLKEVDITADRNWTDDNARYRYNQMRFYVTTILPYLDAATKMFTEINTKLADPNLSRKDRKQYIDSREEEMRTKFEDKVAALNITQGILLTRLISRQTGVNVYQMALEMKNPFKAIKWQTWARLNGLNLNQKYNPADEPDLEHIMEGLGYPLPSFYNYDPHNTTVSR